MLDQKINIKNLKPINLNSKKDLTTSIKPKPKKKVGEENKTQRNQSMKNQTTIMIFQQLFMKKQNK